MIILPKYQVIPPGNITYDELVEAAYAGKSVAELASEHGLEAEYLRRYIWKVWPRYTKIAREARIYNKHLHRWHRILLRAMEGRTPLRLIPKSVRHFFYETLPTYQWSNDPSKISITIWNNRYPAAVDRYLLALVVERPYIDKIYDRKDDASRAQRISKNLGIWNPSAIDLLIGTPVEGHEKRRAKKYLGRMIAKWRSVGRAKIIAAKRRYWAERGRHIKIKDNREPGDG